MANGNRVAWDDHEQAVPDDFDRMQTHFGRHLMDFLMLRHQNYAGDGDEPIPAVLGGFNVLDIDGRTLTIGEGAGMVFERVYYGDADDYESRCRLIQIQPTRTEDESSIDIELPANATGQPRFVYIYAEAAELAYTTRSVNRLNVSTMLPEATTVDKYLKAHASLGYEVGTEAATPTLAATWNSLVGPVDEAKLPLYAVYCPNGYSTIEQGDVIDLRFLYNPSRGYDSPATQAYGSTAKLMRSPVLETPYDESTGESDAVKYEGVNAILHSQPFRLRTVTDQAAWTRSITYRYNPDVSVKDGYPDARKNRPLYWYALSPLGSPAWTVNNYSPKPIHSRYGVVSVVDAPPNKDGNCCYREWSLACGNSADHEYKVTTYGVFIGSLLCGQVATAVQHLYGQRRIGDKVYVVDPAVDPDDTTIGQGSPIGSGHGIPLFTTPWAPTSDLEVPLHNTPGTGSHRLLPFTARAAIIEAFISITAPASTPVDGAQYLTLIAAVGNAAISPTLSYARWTICEAIQHLPSVAGTGSNYVASKITELPLPYYDSGSAPHRKFKYRQYGDKNGSATARSVTALLGYIEPIMSLEAQTYP